MSDYASDRCSKGSVAKGVLISFVIVMLCPAVFFGLKSLRTKPPDIPAVPHLAELVSASGMILVQNPGKTEWREVQSGALLFRGDLVRTDRSGEAVLRYKSGTTVSISENTVFTVRGPEDNRMEISVSPETANLPHLLLSAEKGKAPGDARTGPFVELDQVIPFGRSLELIGHIEAGSRLAVNGEMVEVSGDGSFKHFTHPFPPSARKVTLDLKVTDLAGRSRTWTATHDFGPRDEGH